jgi:hypothetical protein
MPGVMSLGTDPQVGMKSISPNLSQDAHERNVSDSISDELKPLQGGVGPSLRSGCSARGSFAKHPEAKPRDIPPHCPPLRGAEGG